TRLTGESAVPMPVLALDVQRGAMPGQPGASVMALSPCHAGSSSGACPVTCPLWGNVCRLAVLTTGSLKRNHGRTFAVQEHHAPERCTGRPSRPPICQTDSGNHRLRE